MSFQKTYYFYCLLKHAKNSSVFTYIQSGDDLAKAEEIVLTSIDSLSKPLKPTQIPGLLDTIQKSKNITIHTYSETRFNFEPFIQSLILSSFCK